MLMNDINAANPNFIATMHNIARENLLPDAC
jgi:hypothetical protein